jgi:glycerol uptake operon antiterminator
MIAPFDQLAEHPVIAAVRDTANLEQALASTCRLIFFMGGKVVEARDIAWRTHEAGKRIFFHVELLKGLGRDREGIEHLNQLANPDGIVSTKSQLLVAAGKAGLTTVLQVFLVDTQAYETGLKNIRSTKPDAVEIMPGLMPRVIGQIKEEFDLPLITAGLVRETEEVRMMLAAGADGIAISTQSLWNFTPDSHSLTGRRSFITHSKGAIPNGPVGRRLPALEVSRK